jgi:hypothetical protein
MVGQIIMWLFVGFICFLIFIFPLILLVLHIWNKILNKFDEWEYRKNIYKLSKIYIVGFPSGEIIFLGQYSDYDFLTKHSLIWYDKEYKCNMYQDHEKRYIKKILKNKER